MLEAAFEANIVQLSDFSKAKFLVYRSEDAKTVRKVEQRKAELALLIKAEENAILEREKVLA